MAKYFQFKVWYKRDHKTEAVQVDIIGDIIAETDSTVTVEYYLPNPFTKEKEIRVFEKTSGMEFNYRHGK
jgi:hypothetical protein